MNARTKRSCASAHPGIEVPGCLVSSGYSKVVSKSSYSVDNKQILCFKHPGSFAQRLRREAGEAAQKEWNLAQPEGSV